MTHSHSSHRVHTGLGWYYVLYAKYSCIVTIHFTTFSPLKSSHCTLVFQVKLRFCPVVLLPTSLLRHLDSQREVPRWVTSAPSGMCKKFRFPGSSLAILLRGPLPSMLLGRSRDPRLLCVWLIGSTHPLVHVAWLRMPLGVPRLSLLTSSPLDLSFHSPCMGLVLTSGRLLWIYR